MKGITTAALLAAGLLGPCGSDPAAPSNESQDPIVANFASLTNAARANAGCDTLKWHAVAASVARAHSSDMRERRFFSHTNPDGKSPFDRLEAAGVDFRAAAENILHGEASASRALDLWLNSAGHRANLLECSYTHHGVGRVETHWTHVFLRDPS
jgi:uncharacterized protein YkwD